MRMLLTLRSIDTGHEDYKDIPVTVQLVGQRQDDEAFMAIAQRIDEIINVLKFVKSQGCWLGATLRWLPVPVARNSIKEYDAQQQRSKRT